MSEKDQEPVYSKEEMSAAISQRVNEVRESLKAENQAAIAALKAELAPKEEPPKEYTRVELNEMVRKKEMSESEAQTIFDSQNMLRTEQTAESAALKALANKEYTDRTQSSIDKYKAFDPELGTKGSDSFKRVQAEVVKQCDILGISPRDATLGIELAACRQVYGDEASLAGNELSRPTHKETPGAGKAETQNQEGMPKGLSGREKSYYEEGIRSGRYSGWEAVSEELKYANDSIRSRAAAR